MNERLQEKILTSTQKNTADGCWLWLGQVSNSGRGKIMIKDENNHTKTESAHRASYIAFVGKIPDGMLTRQLCNNRLCVNPEHLQLYKP